MAVCFTFSHHVPAARAGVVRPGMAFHPTTPKNALPAGLPMAALALLLSSSACTLGPGADAPSRAASGTPEYFLVGTIEPGGSLTDPQPNAGCRNPMVDRRDGTRLTLIRSQSRAGREIGDYAVPEQRYGVRAGELLRLDCSTGRTIGIVPGRG
jgi:hypothetical protein